MSSREVLPPNYGLNRGLVYISTAVSQTTSRVLARGQARVDVSEQWRGTVRITAVAEAAPNDPRFPKYLLPEAMPQLPDGEYSVQFALCGDAVFRAELSFLKRDTATMHGIDRGPVPKRLEAGTGEYYPKFEVWSSPLVARDRFDPGDWIFLVELDEVIGVFGPVPPYRLTPQNPELEPYAPDILRFGELDFEMDDAELLSEAGRIRRAQANSSGWSLRYVLDSGLIEHLRRRIGMSTTDKLRNLFGG